ncbi:MAG TPA: methyltransferase domain-containing protein [Longimicrobiaceae bacterium]|nr:methyltransferase domain-containing protein [Longimicrobiaceae bacterium]
MTTAPLSPAAQAFDAVAGSFERRYGGWLSVAAQRRAVRSALRSAFPPGARVLELGGGTGEDALWLARHGRSVLTTDASPAMVRLARERLRSAPNARAEVAAAEEIGGVAPAWADAEEPFDGAFSNFAALNCVPELEPVARGLAGLLRPGARALLVLFGPLPPGEVVVQIARGTPREGLRRLARGEAPARLGGREFRIRYHRPGEVERAMVPWFRPVRRLGIGVFVPPSAAEPWISRHPALLRALEALDRVASRPLALLGDHVLYDFRRTADPAPREAR